MRHCSTNGFDCMLDYNTASAAALFHRQGGLNAVVAWLPRQVKLAPVRVHMSSDQNTNSPVALLNTYSRPSICTIPFFMVHFHLFLFLTTCSATPRCQNRNTPLSSVTSFHSRRCHGRRRTAVRVGHGCSLTSTPCHTEPRPCSAHHLHLLHRLQGPNLAHPCLSPSPSASRPHQALQSS